MEFVADVIGVIANGFAAVQTNHIRVSSATGVFEIGLDGAVFFKICHPNVDGVLSCGGAMEIWGKERGRYGKIRFVQETFFVLLQ